MVLTEHEGSRCGGVSGHIGGVQDVPILMSFAHFPVSAASYRSSEIRGRAQFRFGFEMPHACGSLLAVNMPHKLVKFWVFSIQVSVSQATGGKRPYEAEGKPSRRSGAVQQKTWRV